MLIGVESMKNESIKVLLIEDNEADTRFISEMFKEIKPKFELQHATKLNEGLNLLKSGDFDVLLLDLSLPDSMGFETFENAHAQEPELPIVILSGLDDEELAIKAVRMGAQDYLIKGDVNNRILSRSISYAIERKNTEKELIESRDDLVELIKQYTEELKKKGVREIDGVQKKLEEKIHTFHDLESSQVTRSGESASNIQLFNERVPKSLWIKVANDFKRQDDKLSVSEKDIKVSSAQADDLEDLVEIIKELGERGYFAEEHYVVDLE